jgi:outer membrane murein-binding lipoprotein Lpp
VSPVGERVAFQLDRFELTGEDRLEVSGRWFGVRGLRFVRPSLTLRTPDGERSILALLEHKPWAAEEGEAWIAAFPWTGEPPDPGMVELAVAPSVVVGLAGEARSEAGARRPSLRQRLDEERQRVRHLESEVAWLREEREALVADRDASREEAERLSADLNGARAEGDAATAMAGDVERRLEEALQGIERASRLRDEAVAERDAALSARDEARDSNEGAASDVARLERERDEAVRERDAEWTERRAAEAERDEALNAARSALAERDAALGRGSGFPAMSVADLARQPHAPDRHAPPLQAARIAAVIALVVLVIVLVLVLKLV